MGLAPPTGAYTRVSNPHRFFLCVTAYEMPLADAYDNDAMEDPLAYLDAYDSSYEEESVEYPQYTQNKEELYNDPKDASPEMPEPEAEAEEDPYGQESDAPEYPNATEYTEMPEDRIEDYDWPTKIGRAHV